MKNLIALLMTVIMALTGFAGFALAESAEEESFPCGTRTTRR